VLYIKLVEDSKVGVVVGVEDSEMVATDIVVVAPEVVANVALDVAAKVLLSCEIEELLASVDTLIRLVLIVMAKDVVGNVKVDVSLVLGLSGPIIGVELLWMIVVVDALVEAVKETAN
jgi:hypothetical protein